MTNSNGRSFQSQGVATEKCSLKIAANAMKISGAAKLNPVEHHIKEFRDSPLVFPDLVGPTMAILIGSIGEGFDCLRYFKGLSMNVCWFFLEPKK